MKICVVGAGTMGAGIAQVFATAGYKVALCDITDEFAQTKQGRWLAANAGTYGWSLSFPDGYEDVTGYRWECWHYRYIGVEAVEFQRKWFSDVQQFMLEFIHAWRTVQ